MVRTPWPNLFSARHPPTQMYNSESNVWKGRKRREDLSLFWTVQCTHMKSGIATAIWLQIGSFCFFLFKLCVIYFPFSCPSMVTKSSGNMLNMSDEWIFIPSSWILRKRIQSFIIKYHAVGYKLFHRCLLAIWGNYILFLISSKCFKSKILKDFVKFFFQPTDMIHTALSTYGYDGLHWFDSQIFNQTCISRIITTWSW